MKRIIQKLEKIYSAAAYAEEGEVEMAREIMREEKRTEKRDRTSQRPRTQMRASGK